MLTQRINRLFPLDRLTDQIESAMGGLLSDWPVLETFAGARAFPAVNLREDNDNLYVEAEVPGLTMNEIEIVVLGNEMTLRGQRRDNGGEKVVYHRRERGIGAFQRVVRLPVDIDANSVEATLKNGVLTVRLPKAPTAKPRKIEVKATGA